MTTDGGKDDPQKRPKVDWNDPGIPAGNSPPLPAWPLWISAALWGGFAIFLVVIALGS